MSDSQNRWGLILLLVLTIGICAHTAFVKKPLNYQVVTNAAANILEGRNPYSPQEGLDFFKYSPLAGLLGAPFSWLPDSIGLFLFVFCQFWLLAWGLWCWARSAGSPLDLRPSFLVVAFFSVIFDTTVSIQNAQVNAGILGLMLLASARYVEDKPVRAGLILSLASNLKLFPLTLGLCLLTGFKKKYWVSFGGGLVFWFVLPAVVVGWRRNLELLKQWAELMTWDRTRSLDMLDLGSFFDLHLGLPSGWLNAAALLVGASIGMAGLILFRRNRDRFLHRFLLPVNGLYILLFSYLSESPTSILAVPAIVLIGMEALRSDSHHSVYWILWAGALVLVPVFYSDLVPRSWNVWAEAAHLKTVGYLWVTAALMHLIFKHLNREEVA